MEHEDSPEHLSEHSHDEQVAQAREVVLRLLGRREHSQTELLLKLRQRGFADKVAEEVIQLVAERGWQSDERFTESFVRQRLMQGDGPVKIASVAQQKGIERDQLTPLYEALEVDWRQQCLDKLCRRFGDEPWPQDPKQQAKRMRYLQQRGFRYEHIQWARDQLGNSGTD